MTEVTFATLIALIRAGNRLAELIKDPHASDDEIETAVQHWESAAFKAGKEAD